MSKIVVPCPYCAQQIRIEEPSIGRAVSGSCPKCFMRFTWPHEERALTIASHPVEPAARLGSRALALRRTITPVRAPVDLPRAELSLPEWFEAPNGFGNALARIDTTPKYAEIRLLEFRCTHTRRPFKQTFAQLGRGELFRLVDNGDPESFLRLAGMNGSRVTRGAAALQDVSSFDWCNWQCQHCGHGRIKGDQQDWFRCHCGAMNCASSVQYPRNAAATFRCGACGESGVLTSTVTSLSAHQYTSHRDTLHHPAPTSHARRLK